MKSNELLAIVPAEFIAALRKIRSVMDLYNDFGAVDLTDRMVKLCEDFPLDTPMDLRALKPEIHHELHEKAHLLLENIEFYSEISLVPVLRPFLRALDAEEVRRRPDPVAERFGVTTEELPDFVARRSGIHPRNFLPLYVVCAE